MSFTELMSVVTLLILILVAIVFVKEKEEGTWDIMLLMPLNSFWIILAKMISQILIILIGVWISVGIVLIGTINIPINGSLLNFFILNLLFSFSLGGVGLVIASISHNTTEVGQYSFVIMMPLIFLSGAWTPISSMADWLQTLSLISPVRYYIEASMNIFFRGATFEDLIFDFIVLFLIGVILFFIGYKKIGKLF